MTHDLLVCGILFATSCDQCKVGFLLSDAHWNTVELDEAHEWYERMPDGVHKDILKLRLALLFERDEIDDDDI